jgi:hypothetical protein
MLPKSEAARLKQVLVETWKVLLARGNALIKQA